MYVDVRREESPSEALERWLGLWTAEGAALAKNVHLQDAATMLHVAERFVDCAVRTVLPLSPRYRSRLDGPVDLESLAPLVDAGSRQAARACLVGLRTRGGLALGSAVMALQALETLAAARSMEDAVDAWKRLFDPAGPLHMAVRRTEHAGAALETIRGALLAAVCDVVSLHGEARTRDAFV